VAVADFTNTTTARWWDRDVGTELADMLTNELVATKAFTTVERNKLQSVLGEQNLAVSGRVAPAAAAKIGKVTGAEYLVTGTVSAFEEETSGSDGGLSFGGFKIGGKKETAYLAVDLRVIDTSTGEIVDSRTVEGRSESGGFKLDLNKWGMDGSLGQESKTPIGKAIRSAIIESSDYLECSMVKQDRCMEEYDAKEQRRRESAADAIELD
jgi:curli biogenesis system outer membrane secretion channel CsgG